MLKRAVPAPAREITGAIDVEGFFEPIGSEGFRR
jgi:hypothetical protein